MISLALLAAMGSYTLPGYALGQPLKDARIVVPVGKTAEAWHLRCAEEIGAPAGLGITPAEKAAGVRRCWTTETIDGVERRSAFPRRNGQQEIEFLDDRIVRIKVVQSPADAERAERSYVWSSPAASRIDELDRS